MSNFAFAERKENITKIDEFGGICSTSRAELRRQVLFGASARSVLGNKSLGTFAQPREWEGCKTQHKPQSHFAVAQSAMSAACDGSCEASLQSTLKPCLRWGESQEISFKI